MHREALCAVAVFYVVPCGVPPRIADFFFCQQLALGWRGVEWRCAAAVTLPLRHKKVADGNERLQNTKPITTSIKDSLNVDNFGLFIDGKESDIVINQKFSVPH